MTLWGISVIIFLLIFLVPRLGKPTDPKDPNYQDPADAIAQTMAGAHGTKEVIAAIKTARGLDKPLYVQYGLFVRDVLTNNLRSYRNDDRILSAIARRLPNSMLLAITALVIYLGVAVPVSLLTAGYAGRFVDRAVLVLSVVAVSIPTFWLGRLLQQYPGYQWGWFSVGGGASLPNLALPALTLGIGGAAYYSRLLHSSLTGVMKQDFIRAARARGLSETQVLSKHALKNALIPAVAVLGLEFVSLLSGLIFTEKIFGWPGIGALAVDSVSNQDAPMIMGTVMFAAFLVVSANIVVDLMYRVIDPRVRD